MTKKTIKAPLSYDPGKGRPKEHLAYLNWQEMQELQRINGGNMERGPRGLPSFPPADARGSSSRSSSSSSRSSGGGARDSGQAASRSTSRSTSGGGGGARDSGQAAARSGGGGGGGRDSGQAASRGTSRTSYGGGGRDTGRVASRAAPAPSRSIGAGGVRSISSGPSIRGPVSRIPSAPTPYVPSRAAIQAVRRGPGSISGMLPGNRDATAQVRSLQAITNSINERFGTSYKPEQVSKMARAVAGEAAGEDRFGRAAVANTMFNRIALAQEDPRTYGYMGGTSANKLLGQYDATGMREGTVANSVYKSSKPGTASYQAGLQALGDAMSPVSDFSQTASPKVLNATHYYNPETASPKWGTRSGKSFEPVGRHVFGNAEQTESAVASARIPTTASYDAAYSGMPTKPVIVPASGVERTKQFYDRVPQTDYEMAQFSPKVYGPFAIQPDDPDSIRYARTASLMGGISRSPSQTTTQTAGLSQPYGMNYPRPASTDGIEVPQAPSQAGLTAEDEKVIKQELKPAKTAMRGAGVLGGIATGVPVGVVTGPVYKGYEKSVINKLDAYKAATPAERDAMERRDPSIIAWAPSIGIQPQNDISMYNSWAAERGLRGPGESSGGQPRDTQYAGGIGSLPSGTTAISGTPSTPSTTTTPSGVRPYEYYQWDVGVNIPSPTDPNYTNYQEYLRRRAAARTA